MVPDDFFCSVSFYDSAVLCACDFEHVFQIHIASKSLEVHNACHQFKLESATSTLSAHKPSSPHPSFLVPVRVMATNPAL